MSKLNILYEDNHIIVVVKPYNVLSQGDATGDRSIMDDIKDYIKVKYHKPGNVYLGLVHRLDRPVGGIMVFARSSKAASRLSKAFNEHSITKKYMAIVHGKVSEKEELVDYIEKDKNGNSFISKNGKKAILDYELLQYNKENDCSLVSISLKTGRHHQIRVQLSSRNHSIYGDQKYGGRGHGKQICLWAYSLKIIHPITKQEMKFELYPQKIGSWKILEDCI